MVAGKETPTASSPLSFSGNKEINLFKIEKNTQNIQPLFDLQGALGRLLKIKCHDDTCIKQKVQKLQKNPQKTPKNQAKNSAKDIKGRRQQAVTVGKHYNQKI